MSSRNLEGCRTPEARRRTCRGRHGAEDRYLHVQSNLVACARLERGELPRVFTSGAGGPKKGLAFRCMGDVALAMEVNS
jgi:hypothetical protein